MEQTQDKILVEMDAALDQLIKNAKLMQHVPIQKLEAHELDALEKTQESLLARLMYLDQVLNQKVVPEKPLQEKAAHFQGLHQNLQRRFRLKRRLRKKQLKMG